MSAAHPGDLSHPSRSGLKGGQPKHTTEERRNLPCLLGGYGEADDAEVPMGWDPLPEVSPILGPGILDGRPTPTNARGGNDVVTQRIVFIRLTAHDLAHQLAFVLSHVALLHDHAAGSSAGRVRTN